MQDSSSVRASKRLANGTIRRFLCAPKFVQGPSALAVFLAAVSGACGNPLTPDGNLLPPDEHPLAPTSCGPVPEQTVPVGGSVSVRVCFSDENGDPVSLSASSSRGAVAAFVADDSTVTLKGVYPGTTTVTVMARDPGGLSGTVSFSVWVPRVVPLADGYNPAWSPDGSRIAFMSRPPGADDGSIFVMNVDGGGVTRLTNSIGDQYPVWSPDGSRIAFMSGQRDSSDIYLVNADGSGATNLTDNPGFDGRPAWSPDGSRIAFMSQRDGNYEIYVMNADGSGATNLTNNPGNEMNPAWSPAGARIAYNAFPAGNSDIYVMNADGSGVTRLTSHPRSEAYPAWSPDGKRLAFGPLADTYGDIYVMNADGSGASSRLTKDFAQGFGPVWSPDGARIAFRSLRRNDYPRLSVSVVNADGSGEASLALGANGPTWSPDGQKIVFDCNSGICLVDFSERGHR